MDYATDFALNHQELMQRGIDSVTAMVTALKAHRGKIHREACQGDTLVFTDFSSATFMGDKWEIKGINE